MKVNTKKHELNENEKSNERERLQQEEYKQKQEQHQANIAYLTSVTNFKPSLEAQTIMNEGSNTKYLKSLRPSANNNRMMNEKLVKAKQEIKEILTKLSNPELPNNNRIEYNRQLARLESVVNPIYETINNSQPRPPEGAYSQPRPPEGAYSQPRPPEGAYNQPRNVFSGPKSKQRVGPVLATQNPPRGVMPTSINMSSPLYNTPEGTKFAINGFYPGPAIKYKRLQMPLPFGPSVTSSRFRTLPIAPNEEA